MKTDTAAERLTYMIMYSIAIRLGLITDRRLKFPHRNCEGFKHFQDKFQDMMARAFPGVLMQSVETFDLALRIHKRAQQLLKANESKIMLSMCSDIAHTVKCDFLSINRLFDIQGACLGYGPRPGYASIDTQIEIFASRFQGRHIVLLEDGVFSGNTLKYAIRRLKGHGLVVSDVVVGICRLNSRQAFKKGLQGRLRILKRVNNLIDWVPDHDFIPFIPQGGRVLGRLTPHGPMPYITSDGFSYAFPYILPFGRLHKWASVSDNHTKELSIFCLKAGIALFECIERKSRMSVLIRDLLSHTQISLPARIGVDVSVPPLDMEVTTYLRNTLGSLK